MFNFKYTRSPSAVKRGTGERLGPAIGNDSCISPEKTSGDPIPRGWVAA
jgi:hypothetical protein